MYRRKPPFIVVLCSCLNEGRTLTPNSADKAGHVYTSTTRWQVVHTIQLLLLTSVVYAMSTTAVYKEVIEGVFPKQTNTRTHTHARVVFTSGLLSALTRARVTINNDGRRQTNKQIHTHTHGTATMNMVLLLWLLRSSTAQHAIYSMFTFSTPNQLNS